MSSIVWSVMQIQSFGTICRCGRITINYDGVTLFVLSESKLPELLSFHYRELLQDGLYSASENSKTAAEESF